MQFYIETSDNTLLKRVTEYIPIETNTIEFKKETRHLLPDLCNYQAFECWCPYVDNKPVRLYAVFNDRMQDIHISHTGEYKEPYPILAKYHWLFKLDRLEYPNS